MKDYYRILIDGIDTSAVVSRIVCGKSWTGAELSDGSFGIAMHTAGSSVERLFDSLVGLPAKEAAKSVMSWNFEEASEGMAVINAFYNGVGRMERLGLAAPFDRI